MRPFRPAVCAALLLSACAGSPGPRGHAHNDYAHQHPLHDALAAGCSSVEADIFLVDGALRVGHERGQLRAGTLESLYLDPLRERVRRNGGFVQQRGERFWLLIDIKADSALVHAALRRVLADYREMLTVWREDGEVPGAVTVVLSGERPRALVEAERERCAALDGRLDDLDGAAPVALVPWISADWSTIFAWRGEGEMPADQWDRLRAIVARAHAQGRLLRFWGAPDRAAAWDRLAAAGVDWISTDRLAEFADWQRAR